MNKKTVITLVAASLAMPIGVLAADNNSGHFYGRADIGYGISKHKNSRTDTISGVSQTASSNKKGKGFLGTVALGYYAAKDFRTELQFYFDNGFKSKNSTYTNTTNSQVYSLKAKEKSMIIFANILYDFRNSTPFTPYIMGGIGYGRNKIHVGEIKFKNKNSFAYQLGLGTSFQINRNFDIDVGYRLMQKDSKKHSTSTTSGTTTNAATLKRDLSHTLLAGVRVSF